METNISLGLLIEPFYGGSHRVLIDSLHNYFEIHGINCKLITLSAKKWHWKARCGALQIYQKIPVLTTLQFLFCSSVLNLTELLGLRPDLHNLRKVIYFHENQLIYPVQEIKARDIQYAYNQILSCLSADVVLFNSSFNKKSFLNSINKIIKLLPDNRPKNLREQIEIKSRVVYFPISFPKNIISKRYSELHIVWPHRWEFDKGPEDFFQIIFKLKESNCKFKLSILGETFTAVPEIFHTAKELLCKEIINFGFMESKEEYYEVISSSHVVVSTSKHEFFGVSMLEAAFCGCLPLVPDGLVYPELYPKSCLYKDLIGLQNILADLCDNPEKAIELRKNLNLDFNQYSEETVLPQFINILNFNKCL